MSGESERRYMRDRQIEQRLMVFNHKAAFVSYFPGGGINWRFSFPNKWTVVVVNDEEGSTLMPFTTLIFPPTGPELGPNGWLDLRDVQATLDAVAKLDRIPRPKFDIYDGIPVPKVGS